MERISLCSSVFDGITDKNIFVFVGFDRIIAENMVVFVGNGENNWRKYFSVCV